MSSSPSDLTLRLTALQPGKSCTANVRRIDPYLRTARRLAPDADWMAHRVEDVWVVRRLK